MRVRKTNEAWTLENSSEIWDCIASAWVSLQISTDGAGFGFCTWLLLWWRKPTSRKVRCKYFESGCGWHGPLSDRATHQAVCPVMENVTLRNQLANAQRRITSLENDKEKVWERKTGSEGEMRIPWGKYFFHTWQHIEGFLLVDNVWIGRIFNRPLWICHTVAWSVSTWSAGRSSKAKRSFCWNCKRRSTRCFCKHANWTRRRMPWQIESRTGKSFCL